MAIISYGNRNEHRTVADELALFQRGHVAPLEAVLARADVTDYYGLRGKSNGLLRPDETDDLYVVRTRNAGPHERSLGHFIATRLRCPDHTTL